MPARVLPFRRPEPVPPEPEPVRVTVYVDDTCVAHETLTPGGALWVEVAASAEDWRAWVGRRPASVLSEGDPA